MTCENPTLGYVIGYPQGWWANEAVEGEGAVEDVAPCQYFAPSPVAIEPGTDDLGGIAIRLEIEEGDNAPTGDVLRRRVTTIDGRDATVREVEVPPQAGFVPEGSIAYQYVIELSDGRSLVATADNIHVEPATYEEATAVLDRMMERIEVGGPTA